MRDVGKSRAGSTWILCFTFESSASSRSCIDAHPKSGTCREIHTQAQTYSHCPRTPEHRATEQFIIGPWLLPTSISFSSSFSGHPKQRLCPPPSSCVSASGVQSVSLKHARLPMGHPTGPEHCAWLSGAVVESLERVLMAEPEIAFSSSCMKQV